MPVDEKNAPIRQVPGAAPAEPPVTKIWGACCDGVGTPVGVMISRRNVSGRPVLSPHIRRPTHSFTEAVAAAYVDVARTIGWPAERSFEIDLHPLDDIACPLPDAPDGDSLFGALCLALAQAAIRVDPQCIKYSIRDLSSCIRGTALHRVGVMATLEVDTGNLRPAGCIRDKLDGFCNAAVQDELKTIGPRICVIAAGQDLNESAGRCSRDPTPEPRQSDPLFYQAPFRPEGHPRQMPLVRAHNAIDAFIKLWDLQAGEMVRHF